MIVELNLNDSVCNTHFLNSVTKVKHIHAQAKTVTIAFGITFTESTVSKKIKRELEHTIDFLHCFNNCAWCALYY